MTPKDKTLTIKVAGGLGNQLFMFYGGLHIAHSLGKTPVFDIRALESMKNLHPGLNVLDLGLLANYQVIDEVERNALVSTLGVLIERIIRKIGPESLSGKNTKKFLPREIGYIDPNSIDNKVTTLEGYFQSWRYVASMQFRPKLLNLLEEKSSSWFKETLSDLKKEKPIAIHIRRGDFLRPENRSLGVLSKEYFTKILRLNPDRSVWIFSDSTLENLTEFTKLGAVTRIVLPPLHSDPIDSLLLMSRADTLAISNSTFSWWAGALSSPNSLIYAPEKWFERRSDPIDLIPTNWHRIPSEWERQ
jgi:hypothetical protein